MSCTCDYADVTTFGSMSRQTLPIVDPGCPIHGGDEEPEATCVRCGAQSPIREAVWENLPHLTGWWCLSCRRGAGSA